MARTLSYDDVLKGPHVDTRELEARSQLTKKTAGISAIASDQEMVRLDHIHSSLANTTIQNILVEDIRFLYLMAQRALKHEQELRETVDQLVDKLVKAYMGHPIERVALGRQTA